MKKVIAVCVVVVFATLLCQVSFSQERTRPTGQRGQRQTARPTRLTEEQRAELQKAMEQMRELSQVLREVTAEARQKENVRKAFEDIRAKQEALRTAQQAANQLLENTIVTIVNSKKEPEKTKLTKALDTRTKLQEKFRQLRGRFPGVGTRAGGFGASRRGAGGQRPQRPEGARRPRGGGGGSGPTAQ